MAYISFSDRYLGSIDFQPGEFDSATYKEFESQEFKSLSVFDKHEKVSRILYQQIEAAGQEFLLPKVISYITKIRLHLPTYNLGSFEFWLNNSQEIEEEKKGEIRGKIMGKWVPRSEYQRFFPIGGHYVHPGSHYSCAHYSPDLDTTVASFTCFLAAFGAKVGEGRHHWMLPGGPPSDSMEVDFIFRKALGKEVFSILASTSRKLPLTSLDLLKQKNVVRKKLSDLSYDVDNDGMPRPVILVDEEGRYISDWRTRDIDAVRSIIRRFLFILTDYLNHFHVDLISLFALKPLSQFDVMEFLRKLFNERLCECAYTRELTEEQRKSLDTFIKEVLKIGSGYSLTLKDLIDGFREKFHLGRFEAALYELARKGLFSKEGKVVEDRGLLFSELEKVLLVEKEVFEKFVQYLDTLEVALEVKEKVLGHGPKYLSHLAEYEEIVQEMGDFSYLTVNYRDGNKLFPLGVIHAADLYKKILATSSWNDFSNPSETDTRPYVEVISFVDHHKSQLSTTRPASGTVLDAQSSNSIFARYSMEINDHYSTGGMDLEAVDRQIAELGKELDSPTNMRLLERLLQKKRIFAKGHEYYISPEREILEYIQYLFAILDDTDLLTKVTEYDVNAVMALINRLKSLMVKKETEVVHFDDISRTHPQYAALAAKKLLVAKDLYSLVAIIYRAREDAVENVIREAAKGVETSFFQDTKILGDGIAAVGQIKHFAVNAPLLHKKMADLRKIWIERSSALSKEKPDIKLHLFMVSTISSAEELFAGNPPAPTYKDQIWIWVPEGDRQAEHHLKVFLKAFIASPKMAGQELEVLFGGKSELYQKAFTDAAPAGYDFTVSKTEPPMAVLFVDQKRIVSRKTDITPYL